jgi:class 3 adenylate cyclase/GAF domain-containing protein
MTDSRDDRQPDPAASPLDSAARVRAAARRLGEIGALLRSQQTILQKRGVSLPAAGTDQLEALALRLDSLARRFESGQTELRRLRALADTTALITSTLEPSDVLNRVLDTVIMLTGAERAYVVLRDRETGALEFAAARGIDREALAAEDAADESLSADPNAARRADLIISKSVVHDVLTSGEPVITNNALEDERLQGRESVIGYALRSIMAVPLRVRDTVIGAVYCDNRMLAGLFQAHELALLTAFAHQAAVAIENARLFTEASARLGAATEARDLMDNVFASISSAVLTTDGQRRLTLMNAAAQALLDASPSDYGRPLLDLLPELDERFHMALDIVQQTGQGVRVEQRPELAGFGDRLWNVTVTVLRAAQGRGLGLALVIDDLTEQKAREAQLAEVKRYLPPALVTHLHSLDDIDPRGQEREITALFADVRGFTRFSEHLEPEALMRIINRYLSVGSDAINLYGGIVEKYMGDAVTGLFNTQLNPQQHHALRAVQAAAGLMYDLYALHEVLPEDERLYFGVGIHTGVAVVGNVGSAERKEFSVLGEAADISRVLQENAGQGEIIISPQTFAYVQDAFECEPLALAKTGGRRDLTHAYRVLRRKKDARSTASLVDSGFIDVD